MSQRDARLRRQDRIVVGSFDEAAHVFQVRGRVVLLGGALLTVPVVAVELLLTVLAFDHFDGLDRLFADQGFVGVESSTVLITLVLQSLCAHLVGAFAAHVLVSHQLGDDATLRGSMGLVLRRLPLLTLTWALTHWWAPLLALLIVNEPASMLASGVVLMPAVAWVSGLFLFVGPVVMAEQPRLGAIRRAMKLSRLRGGAAFQMVLLNGLLGGLLLVVISGLPGALESTGLVAFGRFGPVLSGVCAQLALLVVQPLMALAAAQLYLQVRIHAEGLDLTLAAERAFGEVRA